VSNNALTVLYPLWFCLANLAMEVIISAGNDTFCLCVWLNWATMESYMRVPGLCGYNNNKTYLDIMQGLTLNYALIICMVWIYDDESSG
jgi:hypothetical protein